MTSTQQQSPDQPIGNGSSPIFVMQSMQSPSERYLSTESLENDRTSTTSSTESPGGVHHRKVCPQTILVKFFNRYLNGR